LDQGTAAQLSAVRHSLEESLLTYRKFNTVQQALKKQIITVFEPMYLDILIEDMVGFANITAQEMIDHLFITYGNITAVDLEKKLSRCARLGIPSSQWRPCSSRFKIVNKCGICQDFFHMQLHERLPQMEREGHCGKDMGKLQGTLRRSSSAAQADAGGIISQFRLACRKCRCWSN
jgi:hypothetical protein